MFHEYLEFDGVGLAEAIKSKQVSAQEVFEAAIFQIEKWNPKVNAVVLQMYDEAKNTISQLNQRPEGERGALFGVPFLIKDLLIQYAGTPTTFGSKFLKDFSPSEDSELMKRYRRAGLVTIGKTNTPEFGLMGITESELLGPCRSPWDLSRTSGGSSGGSGAAVASGMVPIAHGGDGGGSIRIPASACGVIGLKPSRGRMPIAPNKEEGWMGLVSEHVLTRSTRDSAAMLDLTCGFDMGSSPLSSPSEGFLESLYQQPKSLRIAFTEDSILGKNTHPDCKQALLSTVSHLEDLGHRTEIAKPNLNKQEVCMAYLTVITHSLKKEIDTFSKRLNKSLSGGDIETATEFLYFIAAQEDLMSLSQAQNTIKNLAVEVGEFLNKFDVFVTPTLSQLPAKVGEMEINSLELQAIKFLKRFPIKWAMKTALQQIASVRFEKESSNTQIYNLTGLPAISLPLHWNDDNVPIGVQFGANAGKEQLLLQLAQQIEQTYPWKSKMISIM